MVFNVNGMQNKIRLNILWILSSNDMNSNILRENLCANNNLIIFRNFIGPLKPQLIKKNGWKFDCITEIKYLMTGLTLTVYCTSKYLKHTELTLHEVLLCIKTLDCILLDLNI